MELVKVKKKPQKTVPDRPSTLLCKPFLCCCCAWMEAWKVYSRYFILLFVFYLKIKYCRVIVSSAYFDGLQFYTQKLFIDESRCFLEGKTFRTSYITFYVFPFLACFLYIYISYFCKVFLLKVAPLGDISNVENISS